MYFYTQCIFVYFRYFLFFIATELNAQTLGGNAVYNFLTQPGSAQIAALGGTNISHQSNDVSFGLSNPALLRSSMHHQVATSFNGFLAGINNYTAVSAFQQSSFTWGAGVQFIDYGAVTQTDASGTIFGTIRPAILPYNLWQVNNTGNAFTLVLL